MITSSTFRRRAASLLMAAVLGATTAGLVATPAQAATATFLKESEWSTGYVGKLTIHNDTPVTITAWRVEFDLPIGTTIGSHWNANLSVLGPQHIVTNLAWNSTIAPGASISIGWVANGTGTPQNCLINNVPCAGGDAGQDIDPPSTPANARSVINGPTFTMVWDASVDNRGVARYEIFSNGQLFTTTTGTSHSMPIPPPMVYTFGVRAVDAAGNSSPLAAIKVSVPPDAEPPTAPTGLRLNGPRDGYYQVTWEASRDNQYIAGYEVQQSGTVSRLVLVGDTFAFGISRGYGIYMFRIRAFDTSGNYSAPVQIGIAVDPPPPTP